MSHTKRTPEFLMRVSRLKEKVLAGTLSLQEKSELAHILMFNTTDSRCLVNAGESEPIFVLKASDITADACVDRWCDLQPANSTKLADARDCSREMQQFKSRKWAD
jgi:hypothetical protein